jgi:hypothetical protein
LPSPSGPLRVLAQGQRVSSERRHFCRLSLNVRPMAIASPTLFVRSGVSAERRKLLYGGFLPKAATPACGNFSKAKRGILVTT